MLAVSALPFCRCLCANHLKAVCSRLVAKFKGFFSWDSLAQTSVRWAIYIGTGLDLLEIHDALEKHFTIWSSPQLLAEVRVFWNIRVLPPCRFQAILATQGAGSVFGVQSCEKASKTGRRIVGLRRVLRAHLFLFSNLYATGIRKIHGLQYIGFIWHLKMKNSPKCSWDVSLSPFIRAARFTPSPVKLNGPRSWKNWTMRDHKMQIKKLENQYVIAWSQKLKL